MDKFPIFCMLSALVVFLAAAVSTAGMQTGKSNDLPFGSNSVKQIQSMALSFRQDAAAFGRLILPKRGGVSRSPELKLASHDRTSVQISGDLQVNF